MRSTIKKALLAGLMILPLFGAATGCQSTSGAEAQALTGQTHPSAYETSSRGTAGTGPVFYGKGLQYSQNAR